MTQTVAKMKFNCEPVIYFSKMFAESAEFECAFLKNVQIDVKNVYKNTMALGLLCVSRNILASLDITAIPEELKPIHEALATMDEFEVPIRLQELADYYGQFKTDAGFIAVDRIEDVILNLIDLSVAIWTGCEPDMENRVRALYFFNTTKFAANLAKHLQEKLDQMKNSMIPNFKVANLASFISAGAKNISFKVDKLTLVNKLANIRTPAEFSQEYAPIDVWMVSKTIEYFATDIKQVLTDVKESTVPHLNSLYNCSKYKPRKCGSNLQILTRNELMKCLLKEKVKKILDRDDYTDAYLGSILNGEKVNIFVDKEVNESTVDMLKGLSIRK